MKRKLALSLALTLSMGAVCSAQAADTKSAEPAEVVWWTYFGDANIGYLQTTIDAFNESQDQWHVTIEYQGKQAEMNAKIQSTAQEDLPALFSGAVENVAMLCCRRLLCAAAELH